MQIQIQWAWWAPWDSTRPTSSKGKPVLLVYESHLRSRGLEDLSTLEQMSFAWFLDHRVYSPIPEVFQKAQTLSIGTKITWTTDNQTEQLLSCQGKSSSILFRFNRAHTFCMWKNNSLLLLECYLLGRTFSIYVKINKQKPHLENPHSVIRQHYWPQQETQFASLTKWYYLTTSAGEKRVFLTQ